MEDLKTIGDKMNKNQFGKSGVFSLQSFLTHNQRAMFAQGIVSEPLSISTLAGDVQ